jgi:hypothetical protein
MENCFALLTIYFKKISLVTFTIFNFVGFFNKFWAFKSLGILPAKLKCLPNTKFAKLMGSGGQKGFGIFPNFGQYALLCSHSTLFEAEYFIKNNEIFNCLANKSQSYKTIYLEPTSSHGTWDGQRPFKPSTSSKKEQIAIVTRGRIKTSKLWQFWQFVGPTSKDLDQADGLLFSIGIGELPLIQQATFSIWQNTEKMQQYAYKSMQHSQVIQQTRKMGWYKEELFARFSILKTEGDWYLKK